MLARTAFRAAQPLRMHARRYASDAAPKPGGSNTALLGAAAAATLAGAGYYLFAPGGQAAPAAAPAPKPTFVGGEQGWVPLTVAAVEDVNHNTKRLRFHLPEKDAVSGLHVASAVLTKFKAEGAEKATIRPYTPVSDEGDAGFLDLLVKKYPSGPMSSHIHSLAPGQTLDFKGPLPKYPWAPNKHAHVALVAGGTGITPMYQLVRAIFADPADTTRVTLVFGNIAEEDILLRKQLDELENTHPRRFRAFYTLDKPPRGWAGEKGVVSKDLLKQVLPEPKEDNIKVFVCGPPGLMKAVSGAKKSPKDQGELSGALKDLGYSAEQVYKF
ncbi:NADH-cytochrome b5 reductase 2 [Escovopsis weberi]|uniref:NADH-cytochrome b5 reductase n=1 Tax=Escovopsis weberi TaxID=150374 RepID=A0A0M9VTT5_ESCWE|nr:NADH-cytochrome b5 reductase 2 [Escovopsis weberi]